MGKAIMDAKVTKIFDEVGAGTTDQNGTTIDMANYEDVMFIVLFGTSATDNGIKSVQQDTASGMGSAQALTGTRNLLDGTETVAITKLIKPRERYVRAVVERGTSTTLPAGFAIQFGARTLPVNNDASTDLSEEVHESPAEGTA